MGLGEENKEGFVLHLTTGRSYGGFVKAVERSVGIWIFVEKERFAVFEFVGEQHVIVDFISDLSWEPLQEAALLLSVLYGLVFLALARLQSVE